MGGFFDLEIEGHFSDSPVWQNGQGVVMVTTSRDVLWLTNASGSEILYISPDYETLWGRTCRSLYDAPNSWLEAVHPEEHATVLARTEGARNGTIACQQYRIVRPDGSVRLIRNKYFTIKDTSGQVCNLVSIAEDITDRHRLERQYFQTQKLDALGRLAGAVAHDFNNQLTVLIGYCEMLTARLGPGDPMRGSVEQIRRAGDKAAFLTRRLLAFSRTQVFKPESLDLNCLLTKLEKPLAGTIRNDISFRLLLAPSLWKIEADPGQIEQAIKNLVINASEAMPAGGKLTIETANVDLDESAVDSLSQTSISAGQAQTEVARQQVLLIVTDTGQGMTEAVQERLFEPFFTTKTSTGKSKGNGEGAAGGGGLGLATVYGIVKQSGGRIEVCSQPGAGTRFKIYLPRPKAETKRALPTVTETALRRGTETVLLVEDAAETRTMARTVLRSLGYTVIEAKSSAEALTHCQKHKGSIHLLLTETILPKMTGRQLAGQSLALRQDMKVLYLSTASSEAAVQRRPGEPEGPVLEKPFTAMDLARKVRDVLDQRPGVGKTGRD
jgi:two-component system, cell cycle sensor histidine kinase and response regulator CckA